MCLRPNGQLPAGILDQRDTFPRRLRSDLLMLRTAHDRETLLRRHDVCPGPIVQSQRGLGPQDAAQCVVQSLFTDDA